MARSRDEKSGSPPSKKTGLSGRSGNSATGSAQVVYWPSCCFSISIYLFISFISFFFSGGADQSLLEATTKEILTNSKIKFDNAGGRFGAILSNLFINKGFGIASLGIVYLLIIISLKAGQDWQGFDEQEFWIWHFFNHLDLYFLRLFFHYSLRKIFYSARRNLWFFYQSVSEFYYWESRYFFPDPCFDGDLHYYRF